ncbi:MAG: hypothetical protein KKA73_20405 [Chloroflexi bacterium]|nr:hypothetical protein [Chloroflexota bacterium]MBU1750052.1 hypothetical protein [Chloroflexota bacterium]MBU1878404.1 hypothetical protein [Chloroflexota bacterium]
MHIRLPGTIIGFVVLLMLAAVIGAGCVSPTPAPTAPLGPTTTPWVVVVTATPTAPVAPTEGPSPTPAPPQPTATTAPLPTPTEAPPEPNPPVIQISAPGNGSQYNLGQTITVQFTAGDQSGISQVLLYVGQSKVAERAYPQLPTEIGSDNLTWKPTAAGNFTIRAVAYDRFGTPSTPDQRNVVVNRQITQPVVHLDYPTQRTVIQANHPIQIQATINDQVGIQGVELVQDKNGQQTVLTTDGNYHDAPYTWQVSYQWPDSDLGDHTVFVRARNVNGGQGQSNGVDIAVADDNPPQVQASYSATSLSPGSDLTVHVEAVDSKGVTQLQLFIDGNVVDTWAAPDPSVGKNHVSHDLYWHNVSSGQHTAWVWASDSTGKTAQTPNQGIQVAPSPPPVNIVGTWNDTQGNGFTFNITEVHPSGRVIGTLVRPGGSSDFTKDSHFDGHNLSIKATVDGSTYVFTLMLTDDGSQLVGNWIVTDMGVPTPVTFIRG